MAIGLAALSAATPTAASPATALSKQKETTDINGHVRELAALQNNGMQYCLPPKDRMTSSMRSHLSRLLHGTICKSHVEVLTPPRRASPPECCLFWKVTFIAVGGPPRTVGAWTLPLFWPPPRPRPLPDLLPPLPLVFAGTGAASVPLALPLRAALPLAGLPPL